MKSRGSSIGGADEVEKGIRHPLITNNHTTTVFVPLGPWAAGKWRITYLSCFDMEFKGTVPKKLAASSNRDS